MYFKKSLINKLGSKIYVRNYREEIENIFGNIEIEGVDLIETN
jgi:hypothetical protein